MPHELIDYSLTAVILSWLSKNAYLFFRERGNGKPNGAATASEVRTMLTEHTQHEEKLLGEIVKEQRETNKSMVELVTIARMKWN